MSVTSSASTGFELPFAYSAARSGTPRTASQASSAAPRRPPSRFGPMVTLYAGRPATSVDRAAETDACSRSVARKRAIRLADGVLAAGDRRRKEPARERDPGRDPVGGLRRECVVERGGERLRARLGPAPAAGDGDRRAAGRNGHDHGEEHDQAGGGENSERFQGGRFPATPALSGE